MKIAVVGAGHVGLVTGACFADLGNTVICIDIDKDRIAGLKKNRMPYYEPGLEEIVKRNQSQGRLFFTTDLSLAVKKSEIIFIAVGTPPKDNGDADLTFVENVAKQIAISMNSYKLVVEKSTVPVETGKWVGHTISIHNKKKVKFDVASNPEFLREGSAIKDFMHPDRVVLGVESNKAKEMLLELYKPLNAPILVTDINSAEIIKHASNSFLATKISFINAVANICECVKADVEKVAEGMGLDKRIGREFLNAGSGYGGFCFPKDVEAFIRLSEKLGYDFQLLRAVKDINESQKQMVVRKAEKLLWNIAGKVVGVLGLAFKPDTDDMRFAPSIDVINILQRDGADIKAFDPQAIENAQKILKDVKFCKDAYEVAKNADCLIIMTEWNQFKELDLSKIKRLMKQPVVIDGRNIYDPEKMKKMGFRYIGVGR